MNGAGSGVRYHNPSGVGDRIRFASEANTMKMKSAEGEI